jgi:hypothetical protein
LDEAREMWIKSRDLYAKIKLPHEAQHEQDLIDGLPTPTARSDPSA